MSTPVLEVKNLEIKYHTREGILTAIRDVNFEIGKGEIVGLVGESGCGKSTVASAVLRLLPPNGEISAGQILFRGTDLIGLDPEQMRQYRGQDLAMVFQDAMTSLNPVFTIEQQMLEAQRAHLESRGNGSERDLRRRAVEMLDRVGIPDAGDRIKEYPHQFSGGMRQRIMIANALLSNPGLLVADEPTSALDVTLEAQILKMICGLRDELDTAMLYITHDLGVIAQICDRVIVMYAGNIVETGDVLDIFEEPKHPYTQALLRSHPSHQAHENRLRTIPGLVPSLGDLPPGCKFAPRCDLAKDLCHHQEPAYWEVGKQEVYCHAYAPEWDGPTRIPLEPAGESVIPRRQQNDREKVLIQTVSLHKHFQARNSVLDQLMGSKQSPVRAVDGVDLTICKGETLGLVGESGSGKTTLARTILRLIDPTMGKVVVLEKDISELPARKILPLRARMQMIFQDPLSSLSPRMKASALLVEPYRIHKTPPEQRKSVEELLAMVGLAPEQADKYPHQLSGGQARRLGIARALALEPAVLMADEPTAGLDVSVAAGILNLLKELGERLGLTYLIITHNLNVIGFISDRVAVMYLGHIVELADTETLFQHPKHPYTEALMSAIPVPDPRLRDMEDRILLSGEIPSPRNPPPGCPFHPRCRYAEERCQVEMPLIRPIEANGHLVACHFPEKVTS